MLSSLNKKCQLCNNLLHSHIYKREEWIISPRSCNHISKYHRECLDRISGLLLPYNVLLSFPTVSVFEDPRCTGKKIIVRSLKADHFRPCALICFVCPVLDCCAKWARAIPSTDEPWDLKKSKNSKFVVPLNQEEWYDTSESDEYETAVTSSGEKKGEF